MSMIVTSPVKASSVSHGFVKLFKGFNFETYIGQRITLNDTIKVSDLKGSKALAKSGMGAKPSPVSFIDGLIYLTTCYAWGQGNADTLGEGLPEVSRTAFAQACANVKMGAGITGASLRDAIIVGMKNTLLLPVSVKTKKALPETTSTSTVSTETETETETAKPQEFSNWAAKAEREELANWNEAMPILEKKWQDQINADIANKIAAAVFSARQQWESEQPSPLMMNVDAAFTLLADAGVKLSAKQIATLKAYGEKIAA